eukprot:4715509-Pyramimonas_sp.AAC.1
MDTLTPIFARRRMRSDAGPHRSLTLSEERRTETSGRIEEGTNRRAVERATKVRLSTSETPSRVKPSE